MAGRRINNSNVSLQLQNQFTMRGSITLQAQWTSNMGGWNPPYNPSPADEKRRVNHGPMASYWVPHPRSGIFYPKGQEWVMGDVPSVAASFEATLWLRNTDAFDH